MKALVLLLALASPGWAQSLPLAPCKLNGHDGRCGTFSVPEDPARPDGRGIALRVFVLPASKTPKQPEPIFTIEGGPGVSTVQNVSSFPEFFGALAPDRDVIAVDERGTGESNPLVCPGRETIKDIHEALATFSELALPCLPWARAHAALEQYHALNAIRDLDQVRAALGYDKINLWALSHGTRNALLYVKHYPEHVRAVVLEGPLATSQHLPAGMAVREEEVLRARFAECAADHDCAAAYPRLEQDYRRAVAAFRRGDLRVPLTDPYTRQKTTVTLSRGQFGEILRNQLYLVPAVNGIPGLVHAAAGGDWAPVVLAAAKKPFDAGRFPFAQWMSYVCAEDIPYVDLERERKQARGTVLGDYRAAQQKAACALWPAARLPKGWDAPVASDVPVLLMVGEFDSVTWPARARELAATLPRSQVVEVRHAGHMMVGQPGQDECLLHIEGDFLEKGSTQGLDTACAAKLERGPWK